MSDPDDRQGMATIYLTLRYLADIDYPPRDDRLVPYRRVELQQAAGDQGPDDRPHRVRPARPGHLPGAADDPRADPGHRRGAEVLLERRVYLRRSDGRPLRPVYTKLSYPYPRLYDFLAGLHILTRAGYVGDERCANALDLLDPKLLPGEGWAMERRLFTHAEGNDGFTHAPWERLTLGRGHLLLTVDALEVLRAAGRW